MTYIRRLNTTTGRLAERLPEDVDTSDGVKQWLTWTWDADTGLGIELLGDAEVADWVPGPGPADVSSMSDLTPGKRKERCTDGR